MNNLAVIEFYYIFSKDSLIYSPIVKNITFILQIETCILYMIQVFKYLKFEINAMHNFNIKIIIWVPNMKLLYEML